MKPKFARRALLISSITLAMVSSAQADTLYWDSNGTGTSGAGATPTGTWGTSAFWSTDSTGANIGTPTLISATTNADDLFYVAGPGAASGNNAYIVTVSGARVANSLNFQASGATTFSSGTSITLGNGTPGAGGINMSQFAYGSTAQGAVTLGTAITLNNNQIWTNNSASTLSVTDGTNGVINNNGFTLTFKGTGVTSKFNILKGNGINGAGGVIVDNAYLDLRTGGAQSTNTYTGATTVQNGGAILYFSNNIGTGNITLSGGTIEGYFNEGFTRQFGTGSSQFQITGGVSGFGVNGSSTIDFSNVTSVQWGSASFSPSKLVLGGGVSGGFNTFAENIDLNNGSRTILTPGAAATGGALNGVISTSSGTGSLVKEGTGTLNLANSNTYNGGTTISQGTLQFNTRLSTPATGTVTVASGATLGVIVAGSGTTWGGGTGVAGIAGLTSTANGGDGFGGQSGAVVNFDGNSFLGLNATSDVTESNAIGNGTATSIGLIKSGTSTLTLSGTNTYSGGSTTSAGTLLFQNLNAKPTSGTHAFNAGTTIGLGVATSGSYFTSTDVGNAFSGTMTGNLSNVTVTTTTNVGIDTTAGNFTFSSSIAGSPAKGLTKFGANSLLLSGTNTYTGATTVNAGTLAVSNGSAISNSSTVSLANVAGVTFQLNNSETISNLAGGGTTGGTVALQGNALTVGDTTTQTYAGTFTGTSGSSIIKQGSGTLTLSNVTNIPGTATINAGTLQFNTGANLTGGTITLNGNAATLLCTFNNGSATGTSGLGGYVVSNPIVLGSGVTTSANLWTGHNSGKYNFTGGITGAASATQTLNLATNKTATGGDRHDFLVSGVIANGLGGTLSLSCDISVQTATEKAFVNLSAANNFTGGITASRAQAGALSWLTIGGERWADSGGVVYGRQGTGRLADNNSGVYAGAINFGTTAANIVTLSYFSTADQTLSGVIGGGTNKAGALLKEGSGTLTLTAANGYTNSTTVGGGMLALAFNTGVTTTNILPSAAPLVMGLGTSYVIGATTQTISSGATGGTLQLAGTLATTATQTVASLTTAANTASNILVGANRTLTITSGTVTIGANSSLNFNTAAGLADASTATVGTAIVGFSAAPTAFTNGFTVTDSTGFGLAKVDGSNQVIRDTTTSLLPESLAGSANNYRIDNNAGASNIAGSSTLTISASQSAKSITVDTTGGSGVLTLNSGVVLSNNIWNFGGNNNYQVANATGAAAGTGIKSVVSADTFVINNYNSGTVTFTSPFLANGANALVVNGTGTTVLGGANTYTGATSITGGTLRVTGNLVAAYNAAITISPGATFRYSSATALTLGSSANITGGGAFTVDGGADLTIQGGTSTWTGPTLVSGSQTRLIVGNAIGALSAGSYLTIASGGQMYVNLTTPTVANNMSLSGIGYTEAGGPGGGTINMGAIRLPAGATLSRTITLAGNSRIGTFVNTSTTETISGQITGSAGIDLWGQHNATANAIVTFVLSNPNNDYTGNTTINTAQGGGTYPSGCGTTLKLGASNVIPDGASAGNVVFTNGTWVATNTAITLDLAGFSDTINGVQTVANASTVAYRITNSATGASVLTVGANDTTSSFSGNITDAGTGKTLALTKTGSGILTLSGTNTYIGATTVSQGTLALTGGSQTSPVTVSSGASLSFTLGSPTTSTSTFDLSAGTIKITGTPTLASYTLITSSTGITGTPTLDTPIAGYALQVSGNALNLVQTGPGPVDHFAISAISSPQTVGMPITGITLTAQDSSNATATSFSGTVTFSGTGGFSGTSGTFSLGVLTGVNVTPTVIGSSRTLIVDDGASHTGTATFDVQSLYSAWASANGATGGTAGNPDGDGLSNLQEYAFGTNPTASTGEIMYSGATLTATGAPKIVAAGGMYSMVFGRRADYVAAGLTYTVEFTAGLGVWVANNDGTNPPVQIATDGTINAMSVPYPDSITTPSGTQKPTFSRVKVELAP